MLLPSHHWTCFGDASFPSRTRSIGLNKRARKRGFEQRYIESELLIPMIEDTWKITRE